VATAAQLGRELSAQEKQRLAELFSARIERHLDSGAGSCALAKPNIASMVADAIRHFDKSRYRLLAWCVMPNHVHVVVRLFPGQELAAVIHSWKSFTGKQINRSLGRSGPLWGREYYDHLIRDGEQLSRILRYVANNPIKAGLKEWPWWGQDAPRQPAGRRRYVKKIKKGA
jgi:REP element-mobilizing transposase RayT